jgi:CRP/FNR family cyclic AMP-dependent transcriptional regulator
MGSRQFTGGWPFEPVPRGGRISRQELVRREAALARAPLFSSLSKRQLRSLANVTAVSSFQAGAEVVKEDSGGWNFYVILDGEAKAVRRGRTLKRFSPGDFFGEISVLDGGPRIASVVAERTLVCLTLAREDLLDVMKEDAPLAVTILQEVAGRLRITTKSLVD